jgi:hypothetical protein
MACLAQYLIISLNGKYCALVTTRFSLYLFNNQNFAMYLSNFNQCFTYPLSVTPRSSSYACVGTVLRN